MHYVDHFVGVLKMAWQILDEAKAQAIQVEKKIAEALELEAVANREIESLKAKIKLMEVKVDNARVQVEA